MSVKLLVARYVLFTGLYATAALVPEPLWRIIGVMPFAISLWFLAYYEGGIYEAKL